MVQKDKQKIKDMEKFNLIQQITLNDNSKYYELANIKLNGFAERAAIDNKIKEVRIVVLNIPRSSDVLAYEDIVNESYDLSQEFELIKHTSELSDILDRVLKDNHIK